MPKQNAPATFTTLDAPEPRRSARERKATTRFVEGWFGVQLPRLSSALGVGAAAKGSENNCATKATITKKIGHEASSSHDDETRAFCFEACDEVQVLGIMVEEKEEEGDHSEICASEPRRSGRERKATKRFEEGWFEVRLPNLSAALGVGVRDGKGG